VFLDCAENSNIDYIKAEFFDSFGLNYEIVSQKNHFVKDVTKHYLSKGMPNDMLLYTECMVCRFYIVTWT
jgi:hypothetical protein